MGAKERTVRRVQHLLQARGVSVGAYRWTYPARRQQLWSGVDHMFDVGANAGQFGREVRLHGYTGLIHSYEPLGDPFRSLAATARTDGRWTADQVAVGAEDGVLQMNVSEVSTFSSLLPVTATTLDGFGPARYVREEQVRVVRLDDVVSEHVVPGQRHAIKVDVQGFERQVIQGGEAAVAAAVAVEIELSPVELYEGEWMMLDLLGAMDERGFVPALIDSIFPQTDGRSLAFNGLFVRP